MIVDLTTAAGTQKIWKQERFVLYGHGQDYSTAVKVWTNLHGSSTTPLATYQPHDTDKVYIDMTDYVRTYPSVTSIFVYGNMQSALELPVQVVGLINPDGVIIPPKWEYAKIVPPDMMYGGLSGQVLAEFYNYADGSYSLSGATWNANKRGISPIGDSFDLYLLGTPTQTKKYAMRKQVCGVRYAVVEWVSFSGATRRHIFEVTKAKTSTANAYSLLPTDNEYVEVKGRVYGFTLRLDGLNAYDIWYYADMINSSKVRVSLDGTSYEQVQVTDKSVTLPDGEAGTDGKLEMQVNYKRYDAVAM